MKAGGRAGGFSYRLFVSQVGGNLRRWIDARRNFSLFQRSPSLGQRICAYAGRFRAGPWLSWLEQRTHNLPHRISNRLNH